MESNQNNYLSKLNRARRKRKRGDSTKYFIIAGIVVVLVLICVLIGRAVSQKTSVTKDFTATASQAGEQDSSYLEGSTVAGEVVSESEATALKEQDEKQAVIDSYQNLGMVQVSGYVNIRSTPQVTHDNIIGKLESNSACEILEIEGEWCHISSGGIDGYVNSQFIIAGEEAKQLALDEIKERAVVTGDKLRIREAPETDAENVVGQALKGERYLVVDQIDGWVQLEEGYVAADYVSVGYALNEARKLDLREMALNQYDNLMISKVDGYLNVRSEPKEDGQKNIIGKLPGKAAGEILETLDGWYKIKSGNITGYVSAQYTATGQEAKDIALQSASLMAIIKEERMNVRKDPTVDSTIWTQISKEERYPVVEQLDGWVKIELDSGEEEADAAFVSTGNNYVEVRYALNEAIKFSPVEEKVNQQQSRRSQIVNYALQFVGNPYVWGGTSLTKGADCSGFTLSVLAKYGIQLPHYSGSQAKMGRAVKSSEMRPGDLIFYASSSGTINHVSMYIGNGQVVHAASRKSGIKISTWNYRTPKAIRNVID